MLWGFAPAMGLGHEQGLCQPCRDSSTGAEAPAAPDEMTSLTWTPLTTHPQRWSTI